MPTPRLKLRVGISCFLNFIGGGNACYLENVARIDAYKRAEARLMEPDTGDGRFHEADFRIFSL